MRRRLISAFGTALCALVMTACASMNINAVPLPGSSYADGYDIVAEFANALNLPDRAKVVMDGTTVGVVKEVSIANDRVEVALRLNRGVVVPADTQAVMQQATVLGDIYVALQRPDVTVPAVGRITAGGRIPLAQTISPPQLEDTIANLANFIGSGSIQRAQNTVMRVNSVTPVKDEVRRVVSQVTTDLRDLSENIDNVDLMLDSLSQTSAVLANHTPELVVWFSPAGVEGFRRDMVLANTFGRTLPSVGSIYNGGYWLVPMISSMADALESIQGSKQAIESEYPRFRQFLIDYFMTQDKYPAINITSIVGPGRQELSGNVEQVLRMLGAVP
ncbi:MlaD family protein [Mycolicibacterium austroafricanum]|uniref:MlaD family protein n=1 Tax=Mycolicibacterium austroafricanum TaxID=39687 RepID=UPI001CA36FAC|nr:MlaD family protein [Mycolicibacterium austroafricanum]QZT58555.1 MlaD family protein [Mycolicibacterium austroafricanum]